MKATTAMRSAVAALPVRERRAAAKVAESTFFKFFDALKRDGFTPADSHIMAGDAAAAEVAYRFA